jgi:hypothetical protein
MGDPTPNEDPSQSRCLAIPLWHRRNSSILQHAAALRDSQPPPPYLRVGHLELRLEVFIGLKKLFQRIAQMGAASQSFVPSTYQMASLLRTRVQTCDSGSCILRGQKFIFKYHRILRYGGLDSGLGILLHPIPTSP